MKMWRDQSPEWCQLFLEDARYAKVICERENKLAQFSSDLLAQATGVWDLPVGEKLAKEDVPKLGFDSSAFSDFLRHQKQCFDHYRRHARGPVFEIGYGAIAAGAFSELLDFLGVGVVPLRMQKERLHTTRIIDRFDASAHPVIMRVLDRLGRSDWIEE